MLLLPAVVNAAGCLNVFPAASTANALAPNQLDLSSIAWSSTTLFPNSTLTLGAVDRYYGGRSRPNNYVLNATGGVSTRIFVNGDLSFGNGADLNKAGNPEDLVIFVNGNLSIGNNAEIRAIIYATGAISFGNNLNLQGAITAQGSVVIGSGSPVYDAAAISAANLTPFCTPLPTLSVSNATATEGSPIAFPLTLSSSSASNVTVNYTLSGVSATGGASCVSGVDFINTGGTFTVTSGSTSTTIPITVCGETIAEGDETFTITLSSATNATLGSATATGTIVDDDFIADWQMDEASWNGTSNEVQDSSGNGHHATAALANGSTPKPTTASGSPAYTSGSQNTCNYGQFDTNSGTIRTYGTVAASSIPALPTSFTFSAWIRSTNPSQSGQRILVRDDAQNGWGFSLGDPGQPRIRFFNRNITNSGAVTGDGQNGGCGVFCLDTAAVITANNWFFVAVAIDTTTKRITHYVYNQAGTLVSNTSSAYSGTWADGSGALAIGGETAASSEGRNANFHFKGNIDELRISYGALSQSRIESIMTRTRSCSGSIDHFELSYAAPALTCEPQDVTVQACADVACSTLYTDTVSATLSPSGWVGGNSKTFTGGSANYEYQRTTVGTDTLGVSSSTPTASAATQCRINGAAASTTCSLSFDDSGLAFDVPNLIANKPSGTIKLRAVKKSDASVACVPAFASVTQNIGFYSGYANPASGTRSVSVNSTAVSQSSSTPTPLSLTFDAGGEADINVTYADAGQMQLNATYSGSAATGDTGLSMTGNDTFVSRPAGLCVSTSSNCAAGDITCPVFAQAGRDFNLSVTAVGWESDADTDFCSGSNGDTPNYAQNDIPLTLTLVSPAAGTTGSITPTQYSHAASANATTTTPVALSEVGVFTVTATPPAYFGEALPAASSANIGRISPDYFGLSQNRNGALNAGCAAGAAPFAWSGQTLSWLIEPQTDITAHAFGGAITTNYTIAPYQQLSSSGIDITEPINDNTNMGSNAALLPVSVVPQSGSLTESAPGVLRYEWSSFDTITYTKSPTAVVIPFTPALTWSVDSVTDADGVIATGVPHTFDPSALFKMRYGRLRLENTYGPETSNLIMPMLAEYFDGTAYALNTAESCWSYDTSTEAAVTGTLTSVVANTPATQSMSGGVPPTGKELVWAAPGAGTTGTVTATYTVPDYLKFDWDNDGTDDDNPTAEITFGQYRGNDRIIYWREVAP